MPIFEYKCKNCDLIIEKVLLTNKQIIKCPNCNSNSNKIYSKFETRHSSDSIRNKDKKTTSNAPM